MGCQWLIVHRLRNLKPKLRREVCGRKGELVSIKGGAATVELCARHRMIFREESHQSNMADLFNAEQRRIRRFFLASHLAQGGIIDPEGYSEIVREVIADFPELFAAPATTGKKE
jgi:hypothetical protein